MIRMSDITAYLICPRLCYYRVHYGDDSFTETNAVREIYMSHRRGFDIHWAEERCRSLYGSFDPEIFTKAAEKFVLSPKLDELRAVDWDIVVKSEKLGLSMVVDELVEKESCNPLFISTIPPERGVWFRDVLKAVVADMMGVGSLSYFYYAYTGDLRTCRANLGMRRKAIKLIERVRMVKKGFLPERKEGGYCAYCNFSEECGRKPETFASKFL